MDVRAEVLKPLVGEIEISGCFLKAVCKILLAGSQIPQSPLCVLDKARTLREGDIKIGLKLVCAPLLGAALSASVRQSGLGIGAQHLIALDEFADCARRLGDRVGEIFIVSSEIRSVVVCLVTAVTDGAMRRHPRIIAVMR